MGVYYTCKICGTDGKGTLICDCMDKRSRELLIKTVGMILIRRIIFFIKDLPEIYVSIEVWKKDNNELILRREHCLRYGCSKGQYDIVEGTIDEIVDGIKNKFKSDDIEYDIEDITC